MTAAMILCAGLGTRLRPLSDWRPKPLVPVGDRPALAHVLDRVRALGGAVVVNAHHRAGDVRAFAEPHGMAVSEEADELLGTAGGIAHARALLGDADVLVWNGDVLSDVDVAALARAHASRGGEATLAVIPRARGEGNVGVDASGQVVRLRRETTAPGEARGGDFIGVYMLGARQRASLPVRGGMVEDVWLPALHRGARMTAFDAPEAFFDIGTPEHYLAANMAWLRARGASSWCGDGASIGTEAHLVDTVLGAGARVSGAGEVARCVIWPGAVARAPLANAIVAPEGVVAL